jgi:uncharacterized protein YecE (DUF72 family)
MARAFIGTSGYNYNHWRGVFYPEDLPQNKWLEYYCKFFDTVELNVTFYRLPQESAFKSWYKRTPKNFKFVVKGSRFITHVKRLKDFKQPTKLLFSRIRNLKEKLGPILWQFPSNFKANFVNIKRLESFCRYLSHHFISSLPAGGEESGGGYSRLRFVFEFRDCSWFCDEVYKILKKYNCALCYADYPFVLVSFCNRHPERKRRIPRDSSPRLRSGTQNDKKGEIIEIPQTADFVYIRRHGATALYASNYSDKELKEDAKQIKKWLKSKKDVYIYFNNDAQGYAVKNALYLKKILKI